MFCFLQCPCLEGGRALLLRRFPGCAHSYPSLAQALLLRVKAARTQQSGACAIRTTGKRAKCVVLLFQGPLVSPRLATFQEGQTPLPTNKMGGGECTSMMCRFRGGMLLTLHASDGVALEGDERHAGLLNSLCKHWYCDM